MNSTAIVRRWLGEVVWLLEYEPTWFPEFGLAVGAIGWGLGGIFTDDLHIQGWAHVLPGAAILLGLARSWALLRLRYEVRVALASLSALLWAFLWCGLLGRYGIVPMMGLVGGAFLIEILTAAKFSIPCARELLAARHHEQ